MKRDQEELQGHWERLSRLGKAALRQGFRPVPPGDYATNSVLRILVLPSFEDSVAWELFHVTRGTERSYLAHRTTWRREKVAHDLWSPLGLVRFKTSDVQPEIEHDAFEPDYERTAALLKAITSVRMSIILPPPSSVGIDGTSYELYMGTYMAELTLGWWQDAPSEWDGLGEAVQALLSYLTELTGATQ